MPIIKEMLPTTHYVLHIEFDYEGELDEYESVDRAQAIEELVSDDELLRDFLVQNDIVDDRRLKAVDAYLEYRGESGIRDIEQSYNSDNPPLKDIL